LSKKVKGEDEPKCGDDGPEAADKGSGRREMEKGGGEPGVERGFFEPDLMAEMGSEKVVGLVDVEGEIFIDEFVGKTDDGSGGVIEDEEEGEGDDEEKKQAMGDHWKNYIIRLLIGTFELRRGYNDPRSAYGNGNAVVGAGAVCMPATAGENLLDGS